MRFTFRWGTPGKSGDVAHHQVFRLRGAKGAEQKVPDLFWRAKGAGFIFGAKGAGFILGAFPVREIPPGCPCDAQSGRQNDLRPSVDCASPRCELM